jgi:hypothetical protein
MNSEQLFQQKFPLVASIMTSNGIGPGQYSFSATVNVEGGSGCTVSPTPGNSGLFTTKVQNDLTAAGFVVQIPA